MDDVLDVVLVFEFGSGNTATAASLQLEGIGRHGLDVALGRHRDHELFIVDEVFDIEVADIERDLAAARLRVGFAHSAEFFADDGTLFGVIAKDGFESFDGLAQLGHFLFELRPAQTSETRQLHVEDVLGLFGGELERCGHKRFASGLFIGRCADRGDDFIDQVERLQQTFNDVRSALCFVEAVLRTTSNDFDLMIDIGHECVAKIERARNAIDKRHGVDREICLQRRALVEVVENHQSRRVALEAQDQTHLALGGFIVEFRDALEFAVIDQFFDLHDELVGAHLIRKFRNDDVIGACAFFDFCFATELD
ncbi:unannotated protein [freshwater metagenome]|uniref:Unannotated protein n=1 Tax=freshwater metagenome TaxID=449393 RepID=A0A6J7KNT9_9ZZZZ